MDTTKRLQIVDVNYRVFFNTDELPKLCSSAELKIVRYEELVVPTGFTKERCASCGWRPKNSC